MATLPIHKITQLTRDITRVIAPNPSPMTYWGTNTYLLGTDDLAIIDPGPDLDAHLDTLVAEIDTRPVRAILATHAHLDHTPLCKRLQEATGAPIYAFGTAQAGRSALMARLAQNGLEDISEGRDTTFAPDKILSDGATLSGDSWQIEALHTPGHFGNHLSFASDDRLFCGDHMMGWASSLVAPPDGDLTDFMTSSHKLLRRSWGTAYPGHGDTIDAPAERLQWLIEHREARNTQILNVLENQNKFMSIDDITQVVYTDIAPEMRPIAARNVFSHIIALHTQNTIICDGDLSPAVLVKKKSKK